MKVFFIKGKQYVSTSTTGNYTKIVNQLIADHGSGFVYFKGGGKLKIGFSVFNDIELSFPRTLTVPYRQLLKCYMTADDVLRLIDFTTPNYNHKRMVSSSISLMSSSWKVNLIFTTQSKM